jgi:hypothetical protein
VDMRNDEETRACLKNKVGLAAEALTFSSPLLLLLLTSL